MGTGVGEAMLIGAAVGATTGGAGAAIQGGDPLKGALMGGAMGAIGGGLGAAAPAATTATTAGASGAGAGAGGASVVPGTLSAGAPTVGISSAGTGAVGGGTLPGATISSVAETGAGISGVGSGSGTLGSAGFSDGISGMAAQNAPTYGGIGTSTSTGNLLTTGPLGTSTGVTGGVSPSLTSGLSASGPTAPSGTNILGYRPGEEGYLSDARLGAIGATSGLSGLMQAERAQYSGGPPMQSEKRKSSFDPASFAPSKPTYAPEGVYVPEYKDYRTAAEGGIMRLAVGGTVDDEMGGDYSAMGMDQGNMRKGLFGLGYAEGGMPDFGNGSTFPKLPPMSGPLGAINSNFDPTPGFDTSVDMNIGRLASLAGQYGAQSNNGLMSMFKPSAQQNTPQMSPSLDQNPNTNMGGFAGPNSFYGGGGGSGLASYGGGNNNAFPLEGQYGIVKMAEGGVAEILEAAKAQGLTPQAYQQIYGRGNRITEMDKALKEGQMVDGMASGGISSLGGYSDGGRMLRGPGDGMSDSIPASIANKQPARLADGEFVIPADVVSHLGNGSTDAGAKKLYAMMDKVRKARTGNKKQGKQIKANRYMPA